MNSPLEQHKAYEQPSVFTADGLLREARRQKNVPVGSVPEVCLLDPDGDLFRELKNSGTRTNPYWACYHTEMLELDTPTATVGVIGCAVGAAFAVLVAEQVFASGCRFLISVTSAGQLEPAGEPPYFVLIERALRDEGTSYHYLPPSSYTELPAQLSGMKLDLKNGTPKIIHGGLWTTDAPFRETKEAISFAESQGLLAVEMEAAALYAFAEAKDVPVVCFAHVTNQMATVENDFEKGESSGNTEVVKLVEQVLDTWRQYG